MIQSNNLSFQYTKTGQVFGFPNISLEKQQHLLILGASGIGKTTLMHLLAGILKPVSGEIIINQTALTALKHRELDQFRGRKIGLVFQQKHAITSLNVIENLQARLFFSKKPVNHNKIDALLSQLDLLEFKTSKVNALSEGQLQRLGIALAVIHEPQVILADEPTSSLDDVNCKIVIELLLKQAAQTQAHLIVITHDHRIKPYFQNTIAL
ncbi:ATP-binding cassette domain-containing protein [Formosa sediminum]|uniref:ATP-binding cassette domain-containing protein n=1 Tax=Formosa sediminum TaxID=2594004 RepID=A0A516GSU6_9FLAO|nr:ATP-binding cassette domain-containing protein [Formosa sediminum]QDO94450.1 ATP-binding cassette domain-containing protein [Formosa sediminum]